MKFRTVEKGGKKIRSITSLSGGRNACGQPDCFADLSQHDSRGGDHNRASSLYHVTCTLCPSAEYWGETGASGYTRGNEHLTAIRADNADGSALARHLREYHGSEVGNPGVFKFSVVESFKKPLYRQIAEGVKIHNSQASILINNKEEWVQPATVRLRATNSM